jgi:Phage integrase family
MARAVKRAGLQAVSDEIPAPTFHPLPHSHSSALIAQGWDPVEVSARLGHASVSITLMIYAHEFDADGARRTGATGWPHCTGALMAARWRVKRQRAAAERRPVVGGSDRFPADSRRAAVERNRPGGPHTREVAGSSPAACGVRKLDRPVG